MRTRVAVACVVVLLATGAVAWLVTRGPDSRLASAIELTPEGTARVSWTDWAAVRRELDADVSAASSAEEVDAFLDGAFEKDLAATSALVSSAPVMHEEYAVSPATLDWELFAQSDEGAVVVMALGEATDPEELGERLQALGYQRPAEDDGVWEGGVDLLPRIGSLTPELQYAAVLGDEGLLLTSDEPGYLEEAVEVARGDADPAYGLEGVVERSGEPVAGVVYSGAHACEKLAMGQADADAQAEADVLLADAGDVHPMTALAMSLQPGGDLRVVMSFEDEEKARTDVESRARLAAGPAPGQGGHFSDRFTVASAVADGDAVVLDLEPADGQYVLSDLLSGPVLFATC